MSINSLECMLRQTDLRFKSRTLIATSEELLPLGGEKVPLMGARLEALISHNCEILGKS